MKVLIIPEDFRKDQYLLKPIITAMLESAGMVRPKVTVCQNPRLQGITQALRWERIQQVLKMYPMIDLFILCVDRDGESNRRQVLDQLEQNASNLKPGRRLVAENAWQEIEVWALAAVDDLPREWKWAEIQSDIHPKETYYYPYVCSKGLEHTPDEGRKPLGKQAAQRYARLKQLCRQDVSNLEARIRIFMEL